MPPEAGQRVSLPFSRWADRQLRALSSETGCAAIGLLNGATLLGERAAAGGFTIPGLRSAGGGCQLIAAKDGWIALNLARTADRELLPALFACDADAPLDDAAIACLVHQSDAAALVCRGREMGLAVAAMDETPVSPPVIQLMPGTPAQPPTHAPLVIDLSALWAGPLCSHLLWLAGAQVIKVESPTRPDAMRQGDPGLFAVLNQGKYSVSVDLSAPYGKAQLVNLLEQADIVIEAARPRALRQLGIDAERCIARKPGQVWITITGHGASGEAADWVGFGDDCGVAGGLSRALYAASGKIGFLGDAIADPLTGITAARAAWSTWTKGTGSRIGLAMSAVAAMALAEERDAAPELLGMELRTWADAAGDAWPAITARQPTAPLQPLGSANARWRQC